jgi:hypothetical protein
MKNEPTQASSIQDKRAIKERITFVFFATTKACSKNR